MVTNCVIEYGREIISLRVCGILNVDIVNAVSKFLQHVRELCFERSCLLLFQKFDRKKFKYEYPDQNRIAQSPQLHQLDGIRYPTICDVIDVILKFAFKRFLSPVF